MFRVAARRLRSDLRTFSPLLDHDRTVWLREELAWLGGEVGMGRDADVLAERLRSQMRQLPSEDTISVDRCCSVSPTTPQRRTSTSSPRCPASDMSRCSMRSCSPPQTHSLPLIDPVLRRSAGSTVVPSAGAQAVAEVAEICQGAQARVARHGVPRCPNQGQARPLRGRGRGTGVWPRCAAVSPRLSPTSRRCSGITRTRRSPRHGCGRQRKTAPSARLVIGELIAIERLERAALSQAVQVGLEEGFAARTAKLARLIRVPALHQAAAVEAQQLIGAVERHGAVRHRDHRDADGGEVRPQLQLGLDVERRSTGRRARRARGCAPAPAPWPPAGADRPTAATRAGRSSSSSPSGISSMSSRTAASSSARRELGLVDRARGAMLSATESEISCGTCGRNAAFGGIRNAARSSSSSPFHATSPVTSACWARPSRARSNVLLPDPIGPVITVKLPRRTLKLMSCTPAPDG